MKTKHIVAAIGKVIRAGISLDTQLVILNHCLSRSKSAAAS
jgi:hypothetical protein